MTNQKVPPPPDSPLLLERLVGKVESLESMLGELFTQKLPSLEVKLDGLHKLLANRRKEHYLVEEIAELTGRSCYTIRRWIAEEKLRAIRIRDGGPRGKLLIPRSELERLIATGKGADVPTAALGNRPTKASRRITMPRPPFQINEFVGQGQILRPVLRRQDGAMARGEPMPHHVFIGASGLGKSLASRMLAQRAGTGMAKFRSDETQSAIVEHLCKLQPCDFGFFDEAHRLNNDAQELLYEVIDKVTVPPELVVGAASNEPVKVAPITLVFATDKPGQLMNALLKRIPTTVRFRPYPEDEMREIVARIAARRNVLLTPQAARQLARVCHGIPRRAEHRVNDVRLHFADSERRQLGQSDVLKYLRDNSIDADGLGEDEHSYLDFLSRNGSASLEALAGYLGIDQDFLKNQVEQPLRYRGLITVRSSGRMLTEAGKERVGRLRQADEMDQGD